MIPQFTLSLRIEFWAFFSASFALADAQPNRRTSTVNVLVQSGMRFENVTRDAMNRLSREKFAKFRKRGDYLDQAIKAHLINDSEPR